MTTEHREVIECHTTDPNETVYAELKDAVRDVVKQYGSFRIAENALRINHSYLYRLASGENKEPSDTILDALGIVKEVYYVRNKI